MEKRYVAEFRAREKTGKRRVFKLAVHFRATAEQARMAWWDHAHAAYGAEYQGLELVNLQAVTFN